MDLLDTDTAAEILQSVANTSGQVMTIPKLYSPSLDSTPQYNCNEPKYSHISETRFLCVSPASTRSTTRVTSLDVPIRSHWLPDRRGG